MLHGLLDTLDHIYSVCICLLLDYDLSTTYAVEVGFLVSFLYAVNHSSHITEIYSLAAYMADNDVKHLFCGIEFLLYAERIRIRSDIYRSGRDVPVFRSYDLRDSGNSKSVCLELVRIAVDLDLTLRSTGNRHCSYS